MENVYEKKKKKLGYRQQAAVMRAQKLAKMTTNKA